MLFKGLENYKKWYFEKFALYIFLEQKFGVSSMTLKFSGNINLRVSTETCPPSYFFRIGRRVCVPFNKKKENIEWK